MRNKSTPEELIIKELDASSQSTKDMLAVLIQTKAIGTETLKELDQQGRQIGAVQSDVDNIIAQQEQAQRNVRSISSFFWDIINRFRSEPKVPNHNLEVKEILMQQEAKKKKKTTSCFACKKSAKKLKPVDDVIGDALQNGANKKKYDESEKTLDEAEEIVGDLKEIATAMGKEIHTHNTRLDVLKKTSREVVVKNGEMEEEMRVILHHSSPR